MGRLAKAKTVPWLLVLEAARTCQQHFVDVTSPADRRKVRAILARTKGVPTALSEADKRDLRRIGAKIDLKALGADLTPKLMRGRSSRR